VIARNSSKSPFQFKNFSDRIAEVDLRSAALYKIEHVNEIPDENRSYFYQIFEKWSTLNLSQEFVDFSKLITKVNTTTLPQIVHHKDKVIEIMITHFEHATTLSLQPLLE
jgi:U3 small nucleolar RNA-associated protein 20